MVLCRVNRGKATLISTEMDLSEVSVTSSLKPDWSLESLRALQNKTKPVSMFSVPLPRITYFVSLKT